MSEILLNLTRGNIPESIHRGDIVVVDNNGKYIAVYGDAHKFTFMRSSAKPFQAMEVILSGAYNDYQFTDKEISIMCASHYGEEFHVYSVKSILSKIGLEEKDLLCGNSTSLSSSYALELASKNINPRQFFNDCSGKHSGMLSVCKYLNYSINDYLNINHPLQLKIKKNFAEYTEFDENKIVVGIDGCSAPVFALPLYNMALAYAKLCTIPSDMSDEFVNASNIIRKAMISAPEMLAGTNGFCTELIKISNGKLIGKLGAEGVYCVGAVDKNIGFAVKIEDGNVRALDTVVTSVIEQLGLLEKTELDNLKNYVSWQIKNDVGTIIGEYNPVFKL